jgi:hypothetical protein
MQYIMWKVELRLDFPYWAKREDGTGKQYKLDSSCHNEDFDKLHGSNWEDINLPFVVPHYLYYSLIFIKLGPLD